MSFDKNIAYSFAEWIQINQWKMNDFKFWYNDKWTGNENAITIVNLFEIYENEQIASLPEFKKS